MSNPTCPKLYLSLNEEFVWLWEVRLCYGKISGKDESKI
jgi:hypothetical protein